MQVRTVLLAVAIAACGSVPAFADDPPDMVTAANTRAVAAPEALSRRSLGQVALPTYRSAKFRGVRAHYLRQELINDQVIFCGELDAVIPGGAARSGWTKFVYIPGDPTTLFTDTKGLGSPEIGPQVRQRLCESGNEKWLSADFTAAFQRMPASLAEAESGQ